MRTEPALFLVLAAIAVLLSSASEPSSSQAWRWLFDGESLDGWRQVGPGRFLIEDGALRTDGGMGLLWYTEEKFGNVRLHVEFKLGHPAANSGVFLRIPREPDSPWTAVNAGYEVQIDERGDDYHRTGVLYSLTSARARPKLDEWNTLEIVLDGPRTQVTVNGVLVTDYREGDPVPLKAAPYEPDRGPRPLEGYIGLQNHGPDDVVFFRNIGVKDL